MNDTTTPVRQPLPDAVSPDVLPYPNPGTRVQVEANRRAYLAAHPDTQTQLTRGITWAIVAVTVLGALGSIANIVGHAVPHTGITRRAALDAVGALGAWAGAEGILVAVAAGSVLASRRGQRTPHWVRTLMWGAVALAVHLNVSALGDWGSGLGTIALAAAPSVGTAGGVELLAWVARGGLLMATGAEQHDAEMAQRARIIAANRAASRARQWKGRTVIGGYARRQARHHLDVMAMDHPELVAAMESNVAAFVGEDGFRADLELAPAPPAPAAVEHEDTPTDDMGGPVTLHRIPLDDDPDVIEHQADALPALPPSYPPTEKSPSPQPAAAGPWFTPRARVLTASVPDTTGHATGRRTVHARADQDPADAPAQVPDVDTDTDEESREVSTHQADDTDEDDDPAPVPPAAPSALAIANAARADAARTARAALAASWYAAVAADPDTVAARWARDHGTSADRLRRALTETPPPTG
ncbi:hypothetical protein AB0G95_21730 [Streptomyces virginiae]|uniref:hypothetical protein n=1 Tax=Streptomyces virginiae TaxID=1961 RepID=UPI003440DBD9